MSQNINNWIIFIALCIVWGSSFILMKIGMQQLSAYQVASIRIGSAGIILLPFAFRAFKNIPKDKIPLVILSGLLGSFFPAYLYCIAETKIDSSLAAILNSLTPLFTIVIGIAFFKAKGISKKIAGVLVGFIGLILLPFAGGHSINNKEMSYGLFVLVATICYGVNVNIVGAYMKELGSLNIAAAALSFLIIPAVVILAITGFFSYPFHQHAFIVSTGAAVFLGVMGTAAASVMFYKLVKKAGTIFASLVTYGIPFIAVVWGFIFGETITVMQVGCLAIILAGVYLVNR